MLLYIEFDEWPRFIRILLARKEKNVHLFVYGAEYCSVQRRVCIMIVCRKTQIMCSCATSSTLNVRKGVPKRSNVSGLAYVIADLTSIKKQRQKRTKVWRVSYDRIACAKEWRRTGVLAAGMQIAQKFARCGARDLCAVDVREMSVAYDEREAP